MQIVNKTLVIQNYCCILFYKCTENWIFTNKNLGLNYKLFFQTILILKANQNNILFYAIICSSKFFIALLAEIWIENEEYYFSSVSTDLF